MDKKIVVEFNEPKDYEATSFPYWLILDPRQNMDCSYHALAGMVTGPFFSREEAQKHFESRRHAFGKRAVVYCCSGYYAKTYRDAFRKSGCDC